MAKIYKYQKITGQHTTHCLVEPDYDLLFGTEERVTELCTIAGDTYVSVPDGIILPEQPEISILEVILSDDLISEIKAASPHVALINERVVELIRERYSVSDEIKMLRTGPTAETSAYNDYVEECRAWGRGEKAKLGL
ncbi:MAG: hypothetical protein PHG06_20485 [Parabacteroides sp.]|nr:hypothetical protein [Parabacteroides sp.]